jgi:STE24 endopeptidase
VNEDKATRYNRLKRRASLASLAWGVALLCGLLSSGLSLSVRTSAEALAARTGAPASAAVAALFYTVLLCAINEAGSLPMAFYSGFVVERRYGLSNERLGGWLLDQAKAFAIGLVFAAGGVSIVYWLIRVSPAWWWLAAGAIFALVIVALANLAPIVLLPLFYRVRPLDRASLRARLLALADRAGTRVLGAYEWGLGDKTKKANAALAGLGATRRILVSDTMLAEYSDEEIEVVLAHEIAHHVHADIWKQIVFESAVIFAGFCLAALVLDALAGPMGLRGVSDVAGLPLLLLAAGAVSLSTVPVAHAMSRAFERSADRFALDLTRNPGAFISAMRRLGAQNLAEEDPSKIVQWLFYSHPPMRERIAAAQAFRPDETPAIDATLAEHQKS